MSGLIDSLRSKPKKKNSKAKSLMEFFCENHLIEFSNMKCYILKEITDIQDEHIALATLASLDWDLTKAVEASISSHSPDVVIDNTEQSENNRIVGSSREER